MNNLRYELDEGEKVIKNLTGIQLKNKYHYTCMNEVEFMHHEIINDNNARKTMKRRFLRLLNLKNKNIYKLYYHRLCEDTDENQLFDSLNELKNIYSSRNNNVYIYCFEQVIVLASKERRVESFFENGIYKYVFYTLKEWAGKNKDIFLLSVMMI